MKKRIGDINEVENKGRKFGSAACYYHARVQFEHGGESHLLLTDHQVAIAMQRANKNLEDLVEPSKIRDTLD